MARFRALINRFDLRKPRFVAPITPDRPFVAVGDIHGRLDLLEALLVMLESEAPKLPLVFLGDYVDRGPDSAVVLRKLMTLEQDGAREVVCLMGNHEAMMLEFLDMPGAKWPLWTRNGGSATLRSFGLDPDSGSPAETRDRLRDRAGLALLEWIDERPLIWQNGNVVTSHAGGDPPRPIEPHRGHGLLWGHPKIFSTPRQDGLWMVHGHFIRDKPEMKDGRIGIDTGACHTGHLTAAIIEPGFVRFVST